MTGTVLPSDRTSTATVLRKFQPQLFLLIHFCSDVRCGQTIDGTPYNNAFGRRQARSSVHCERRLLFGRTLSSVLTRVLSGTDGPVHGEVCGCNVLEPPRRRPPRSLWRYYLRRPELHRSHGLPRDIRVRKSLSSLVVLLFQSALLIVLAPLGLNPPDVLNDFPGSQNRCSGTAFTLNSPP